MHEFTLRVENMHCGSCVRRVSQALGTIKGVEVKEVRVGAARILAPDAAAEEGKNADLAIAALAKAGYPAHLEN